MPSRIREVLPLARRAGLVLSQPALPKHRLPPRSSAAAAASATGAASQQRSRPVAHPACAPPTAGETVRFLSEAIAAAVAADAQAEAQGGVQGSMQETLATPSPAASPAAAIERSATAADSVFEKAIRRLEREVGKEGLVFPKEITFLNGAPGSGKTHNSRFMLEARGLAGRPIVVSDLLKSRPEFCKSMDAGRLVEDVDVVEVLLRELLSPVHAAGVLVDGFPRSLTQAESCWKLQALMKSLRAEKVAELVSNGFAPTASAVRYPVPRFFVCILHVSEEQSIARQIQRGKDALRHNAHVREVGAGDLVEERATDLNPVLLRQRYRTFERHRDTLERLMTYFPFKIIDASRDVEEVRAQILTEFQYQSKQELSRAAFDAIQPVPLASRVGSNARPDLCQRLGEYAAFFPERFASAVSLVNDRIVPQLRAAAFAGQAIVRFPPEASEHVELSRTDSCCLREMVLDTLAERGYSPHYDAEETLVPVRVDMRSGNIVSVRRVVHVFRIGFPEAKLSHDNIRALNENRESEEPQPGFP